MRTRFKVGAVASSYNYDTQRKIHREYIIAEHEKNSQQVQVISATVHVKMPYTICFGKLIPLTLEEAQTKQIQIIWK